MTQIQINLGGDGETVRSSLTIEGCGCRHDDFVMALVAWANGWKREADLRDKTKAATVQGPGDAKNPCGCGQKADA